MKSLGVIGGVGPETTAEFYLQVIFGCQNTGTEHRPHIIISSIPYSYELENDEIIKGIITEQAREYLLTEAKRLEQAGADFIVLPCNSLHIFIEQVKESVKIPVLNILDEVVSYIISNKFLKIGLISTSSTVKNKLYENEFIKHNIDFEIPNGLKRAEIDKIIKRITNGVHLNKDRITLLSIIEDFKKANCDAVALACTDLQLLLPSDDNITIFDTMSVLTEASIREVLK